MHVKSLSDDTFKDELENSELCLVDVYADWCGPCKQFAKIFEQEAEVNGGLTFFRINADENPKFREEIKIPALPFVVAFRNGQPIKEDSMTTQSALREFIQSL